MKKSTDIFITVLSALLVVTLASFWIYAYTHGSEYIYDNILGVFIVIVAYLLRKKLQLTKFIAVIGAVGLLPHMLGTFNFYTTNPLGIRYDHYTHFLGAFAVSLVIYNALIKNYAISRFNLGVLTFLSTMGLSALVEISEFLGWIFLGEGQGMFFFGGAGDSTIIAGVASEWFNASMDLVFNSLGAIIGIIVISLLYKYAENTIYKNKQ